MTNEYIKLSQLVKSPLNVRKTASPTADAELKASILAHGLMQNLVVVPAKKKGWYEVIAGGRRLEALKELVDEGKLKGGEIPCQIVSEEQAAELSLVENTVRQSMHPADEFEAFAALIDVGQPPEHVAIRFGTTERHVLQRMKLAKVAPALIAAYRAEELTLEALMAFTITDDHARQLAVYESLSSWQKDDGSAIRRRLTEQMIEAGDRLVKFATLQAYRDAGGTTRTDLFGEKVYLEDPALLDGLVAEKLKAAEAELMAEGWGWAVVAEEQDWRTTQGCTRIHPVATGVPAELTAELEAAEAEQREVAEKIDATDEESEDVLDELWKRDAAVEARLDDIEKRIQSHASFDPEQVGCAGCYAYVGHDGTLAIERGLVKRQDAKKLAATGGPVKADKPKGMPESLKRDLEVYRLGVAQAAMANNPSVAFDLLVFGAAKNALTMRSVSDGPCVSFSRNFGGAAGAEARGFLASRMEPVAKALPVDWLKAKTEAKQFAAFRELTDYQKQSLLAYCVAVTLQPKLDGGGEPTAYDITLSLTGVNVAEQWRPTSANYLGRVPKDRLLEIGRKVLLGGDSWANRLREAKKTTVVAELDAAFAKSGHPDTIDKLRNWLPDGMAFRKAPESVPAKTKKPTKAA